MSESKIHEIFTTILPSVEAHDTDMATYVVTSYDFGGSSAVRLHVVTDQLDLARRVYASVLDACEPAPKCADACGAPKWLVELTRVAQDTPLLGDDAPTLFWGGDGAAVCNNNRAKTAIES